VELADIRARLTPHLAALLPGLITVSLMVIWAVHDGGYDDDTWYWGALVLLGLFACVQVALAAARRPLSRWTAVALGAFALYVAWSYLSIAWAASPGEALNGSDRALLYLLVFALLVTLPWTPEGALVALLTFVLAVGVIAVVLLVRLASGDHVGRLFLDGRLTAPTGYLNSTAALFTLDSLTAIVLAARRKLPWPIRGCLLATACAALQLAVIVQSRGWLFTLPLIAVVGILVLSDRLRVVAALIIPVAAALIPLHRLLDVYRASSSSAGLTHAATRAGHSALLLCGAALALGLLIAWADGRGPARELAPKVRRSLGAALAAAAVGAFVIGGTIATHGHPFHFIARQWHGFSHTQVAYTGSHFADVGSGRYDFWRVSLDAFVAHPIGGLGQDNFAEYYDRHRRTGEEPSWTHSLEMRLLAQTGLVGFILFVTFVVGALGAAARAARLGGAHRRGVVGAALLPFVVWLIHGSVDWFWEIPALSAPALGFLAVAASLEPRRQRAPAGVVRRLTLPRPLLSAAGVASVVAAVVVLGFPYLSVRELSLATNLRRSNPVQALQDLDTASNLNPLSPGPGRLAGTIALQTGRFNEAEQRFAQATSRDPGGWFAWLGRGLAASTLGDSSDARRYFEIAASINSRQPAVQAALSRVLTTRPLTGPEAFDLIALAQ